MSIITKISPDHDNDVVVILTQVLQNQLQHSLVKMSINRLLLINLVTNSISLFQLKYISRPPVWGLQNVNLYHFTSKPFSCDYVSNFYPVEVVCQEQKDTTSTE